ncbi:hypothetical protein HMPREF0045_01010 [Actinomyces graevenitzii C83]|uniref:Uncharacterized protein n=2 Tax=Actinomyces graevenitzii TaxID=55565 RepID=G9PFI6_9ACTO|nr:hypothetical protein [Actinomyces graevenitzii]EHM88315.1 hypothetical protein HMPREF0045_01010 [Actinomyces graevenitzii C83]
MARGDDDSSNRTRGRRKSPFPPLRLVQDLPDSDDAAPRSSSGAGKGVGGARVAKPRPSAQTGRSAHPSQGSVRAGAANSSKRTGQGATSGRQTASGQARKPHPAKGGLGQGAASRNAQGRPAQKNSSQGAAGSKAAESKSAGQKGSTQSGSPRGAQRSSGRGGHSHSQARSGQGRSSQARSAQARAAQGRNAGQPSNAQRSQGQSGARATQAHSAQGSPSQGHSGQARAAQSRASQPRSSQARAAQGRSGQGRSAQTRNTSRTGAASTARRGAAGGQRQNPRKQAQGAANRRVNAPGARPSRPQSQAPERRRPPVTRPKKPPRQPMDPALKASLMRLGRNVFLVVLTVVLVVWGFNYVTETVRVQNLQAARQNQGSGMPTPLACDAKNLDVTVTLPAQVARGQALTVSLKVANKANIPCIFDVGSEHLQMRVTSGTDTVYDGATCKAEPSSRKMLLAPLTAKAAGESAYVSANPTPDSFTTSVSWSGQRYKADCSSAGPSQAGTYVLRLNLDGKELIGQQVFIVK